MVMLDARFLMLDIQKRAVLSIIEGALGFLIPRLGKKRNE